tara:strand:- start:1213 stop:1479 length:267 start_codon:yes stop_codon:yes gene_type:complete
MGFSDASSGTFKVTLFTANTVDCVGFRCDSAVVLSNLKADDQDTDIRSTYVDTVGATLEAGTIVRVKQGLHSKFSSVTLASGSITKIL